MSKGRREKKEEEARVLAEFDQALREERAQAEGEAEDGARISPPKEGERLHCRRCKTLMEGGVCPTCGYKIYQPMSEEKRKKIRLVVGAVAVAIFLVLFFIIK